MQARLDALAAHAAGLSLRSGIPLLLLCFAVAVSTAVTLRHAAEENREVERAALELMIQRAIRLQAMLETYYRIGLEDNAQAELAGIGAQRGHRLAAVIDEGGRVIASSRSLVLQEPADAALPRLVRNADLLAEGRAVRERRSGFTRLGEGGDTVAALFPISFDAGNRSLRKERVGLLFIEYDLAERKAVAQAGVRMAALKLTAVVALFALLLWLFLDVFLTRRMRRIVATVRRVAEADFSARTGITGKDEIADIARAFDAMTVSLGETREQLARALEAAHMYAWTFDVASQILVFRRPADRLAAGGRARRCRSRLFSSACIPTTARPSRPPGAVRC